MGARVGDGYTPGRMVGRGVFVRVALGFAGLFVACTTYTEEPHADDVDASTPSSEAGAGTSDSSAPPEDGSSGGTPDGTAPIDGGADGGSYVAECPPCPSDSTCIAAGCTGGATYNACSKPYDVTAPMSVVAFVCPEGPTVDFPQACVPGGGTQDLHVAVFRMGKSPGLKTDWRVSVTGSSSFVSTGDCTQVLGCSGGTNGPSQPRNVAAFATAMIGTTNVLTTCQQLLITFADDG